MNPFSMIIIVALVVDFVLGTIANLLNLKALNLELPLAL